MKKKKLTQKQELFCLEYVVDFNATQAAIRAKYSKRSAYSQAHDLLKKPVIQERVKELTQAVEGGPKDLRQRIIDELTSIAFADASHFFDETPVVDEETGEVTHYIRSIKPRVLDSPHIGAIQSFEPSAYGTKIKVNDKQKALEMLSRYCGLFNADTSQKPENTNVVDMSGVSSEKLRELQKVWDKDKNE